MYILFAIPILFLLINRFVKSEKSEIIKNTMVGILFVSVPVSRYMFGEAVDSLCLTYLCTSGLLLLDDTISTEKKITLLIVLILHKLLYFNNAFIIFATAYCAIWLNSKKYPVFSLIKVILIFAIYYSTTQQLIAMGLVVFILSSMLEKSTSSREFYLKTIVPITFIIQTKAIYFGASIDVATILLVFSLTVFVLSSNKANYGRNALLLVNLFVLLFAKQDFLLVINLVAILMIIEKYLYHKIFSSVKVIEKYKASIGDSVIGTSFSPVIIMVLFSVDASAHLMATTLVCCAVIILCGFFRREVKDYKDLNFHYAFFGYNIFTLLILLPFLNGKFSWLGLGNILTNNGLGFHWSDTKSWLLFVLTLIFILVELLKYLQPKLVKKAIFKWDFNISSALRTVEMRVNALETRPLLLLPKGSEKQMTYALSDYVKEISINVTNKIVILIWIIILILSICLVYNS